MITQLIDSHNRDPKSLDPYHCTRTFNCNKHNEDYMSAMRDTFRREGGEGKYTRLCDKDDEILGHEPETGEIPVLLFDGPEFKWLLTTCRIIIFKDPQDITIRLESISDVRPDGYDFITEDLMKKILLHVDGEKFLLMLEWRDPFLGMWGIAKDIAARNRNNKLSGSMFKPYSVLGR